ncbi:MAG: chromosome segregation protein SMC [Alphaproteobacteria bacterium]
MIQFKKLRLSGFKSFVDKTELDIGPGLNGIVGPNGCGKSNLVEALRWVMGENSAKRMRGGGMEDVIFAGTDKRSPRNFAEVSLLLDNTTRSAPSAYNKEDDIEVVRKIEKDKGSGYKINGKNARARDVQMLFADTVTGSNSPSLVAQGHITRMISAKPQDRRLILEESAGIAGLYARRHEAELRLRAADSNLLRLEDLVGSMENRLTSLKRQCRQAIKYKNINAAIRDLDMHITYLEWLSLAQKQKAHEQNFTQSESLVAKNLAVVTQLTKTQNTQIQDLTPLRTQEAQASAALQKSKLDFQHLEDEIERYRNDVQDAKTQLHQISLDRQHEDQTFSETAQQLEKVEAEYQTLIKEQERDDTLLAEKTTAKEKTHKELASIEERFSALKEDAAANAARKEALEKQIKHHEQRIESLENRYEKAQEDRSKCALEEGISDKITTRETQCKEKEHALIKLKEQSDNIALTLKEADKNREESRCAYNKQENRLGQISGELSILEEIFNKDDGEHFRSILDQISTSPGFEKALSRALGDSLLAALDEKAPAFWANTENTTNENEPLPLPEGASAMLEHVKAPAQLHRALSAIGYVQSTEQGSALAKDLKPGQSLVSANGAYWRWDGYHIRDIAADRHSLYLEQKNKKNQLEKTREEIKTDLENAHKRYQEMCISYDTAHEKQNKITKAIREHEESLAALKPELQNLKDKTQRIKADQKRYDEQISILQEDIKATKELLENDKSALQILITAQNKDNVEHNDLIQQTKEQLQTAKEEHQYAVRDLDLFTQGRNTRRARMQAIADERLSLKNRNIRANKRLKELTERQNDLNQKLKNLEENPIAKQDLRSDMLDRIAQLEKQHQDAAELLLKCENDVASTTKALKEAENTLSNEKEKRAHALALLSSLNEQLEDIEKNTQETMHAHPKDILTRITNQDNFEWKIEDLQKLKEKRDSQKRERDSMGPVNLRAEVEAKELETELTALINDRQDLVEAIEELRGGIDKINKEARTRLLAAFNHVNAHFQELFVRLFGGGKAYLELIDSQDPLGAGLEIFAQPPGKSLQSLSLLSGGEQTLTAIALIFSMFLTNPSPVCVLD